MSHHPLAATLLTHAAERLFVHTRDLIVLLDSEGRIVRVNLHAQETLGYDERVLMALPFSKVSGDEASLDFSQDASEVCFEQAWKTVNGQTVPVSVRFSPVIDEKGVLLGYMAIGQDLRPVRQLEEAVSQRQNVEAELLKQVPHVESLTLASQRHERRYLELFENANDVIFTLELDGTITSINKSGERILGYRRDEISQMTLHQIVPIELLPVVDAILKPAEGETSPHELQVISRDGDYVSLEISSRVAAHDGRPILMSIARDITERKQIEAKLDYLAYYDALTGLPNRMLFHDRLTQVMARCDRYQKNAAVVLLDLDRFKEVNDTLGHDFGDRLLYAVSKRFASQMRVIDTVARAGGDEFFFVFSDINDEKDAEIPARRILSAFADPFRIDEHDFHLTPSIGISLYPKDGTTSEALIKNADMALSHAKAQGKNTFQFFTARMGQVANERRQTEEHLRHALQRDEFRVYYQPQVDLKSGRIIGAEALIRWHHPTMGIVPPLQFIPLAEETGMIISLGDWVLRTACKQTKIWQDQGYPLERIAVNLSPRQFNQRHKSELLESVRIGLEESGLAPQSLELEITESMAMQNLDETIQILNQLHALGIRLAIDDFGTGYSSLTYLKRFPIDALKVDRSFIKDIFQNPEDAAITEGILALAKSLELRTVAEGVEEWEQSEFLRQKLCDEVQGYLYAKPLSADDFTQLLKETGGIFNTADFVR